MLSRVEGHSLWLGSVVDARDIRAVLQEGIEAVVDLAINEPPVAYPRDILNCRFPINDGLGNATWKLRMAIETVASLLSQSVPTLVYCSAGMSRTPAVAAAAIVRFRKIPFEQALLLVSRDRPIDISPSLLSEVSQCLS